MSYFHIGLIIATAAILKVSPQTVILSPDSTTTDIGAESVTFTCTVELNPVSAKTEYGIRWIHGERLHSEDVTELANNDKVFDKDKYSLHGMSSIASNSITQSLTVHGIEEDDNGIYYCYLSTVGTTSVAIDMSYLFVRNVINKVFCFDYKTKQEDLELSCSCYPGDPPIKLQWIDMDGNVLAEQNQLPYYRGYSLHVTYTVPNESLHQGEDFTCKATNSRSVTTQQCIGTPILRAVDTIDFLFTYHQSTVGVTETTEILSITSASSLADKDNKTVIALISVTGAISILANVTFLCYILIKNRKMKNKTEVGTKLCATCILSQECSKQQHRVKTSKQEVGEDDYMEPTEVEDDCMETIGKEQNNTEVGTKHYANSILRQECSKHQHRGGIYKQEYGEYGYTEPIKFGEDVYMEPIKVGKDGYMKTQAHIQDSYENINIKTD